MSLWAVPRLPEGHHFRHAFSQHQRPAGAPQRRGSSFGDSSLWPRQRTGDAKAGSRESAPGEGPIPRSLLWRQRPYDSSPASGKRAISRQKYEPGDKWRAANQEGSFGLKPEIFLRFSLGAAVCAANGFRKGGLRGKIGEKWGESARRPKGCLAFVWAAETRAKKTMGTKTGKWIFVRERVPIPSYRPRYWFCYCSASFLFLCFLVRLAYQLCRDRTS